MLTRTVPHVRYCLVLMWRMVPQLSAMSGTDVVYGATPGLHTAAAGSIPAIVLRILYAMSGTEIGYGGGATRRRTDRMSV